MTPDSQTKYVDKDGRLTVEGLKYFDQMAREIADLKARLAALE